MDGDATTVARRLTELAGLPDVRVSPKDFWMPRGLPVVRANGEWDKSPIREAKLGESEGFLASDQRKMLTSWWLAVPEGANTPNWDIASNCRFGEEKGLLLVEAKAHLSELKEQGKALATEASPESIANRDKIAGAIEEASASLGKTMDGWALSLNSHYQLSNRFAWAWKIASMGLPVVLVYLGFIEATEMKDIGKPFDDSAEWSCVVMNHSRDVVPGRVWGHDIRVGSAIVRPLIRACKQEFRP